MTYDFAQFLTSLFWWGWFCFILGMGIMAMIIFAPAPLAAWLQFHIPWIYGLFHNATICPNGYVCIKS